MIYFSSSLAVTIVFMTSINHLNSQDEDIKFTIELESEERMPFLDVELTRSNDKLVTKVYGKPTNSDLYLQYDLSHPKSVKNEIVNIVTQS
jgi:hydroxypyruvate isomerase